MINTIAEKNDLEDLQKELQQMSEYEKHSMSEKNEEETLEENADETGGLTKEELDEIMADGGMMSRSGGNRRSAPKSNPKQNLNKEPKQKKLRRVLLIVFLVLLVITGVIAAYAYFSTNVYQDDAEFKNYADKQFRGDQLFELNGKTERTYEYGSPISYAADYTVIDNKEIEAFRKTQIDKITAEYKDAQESAEAQRAEENKDDKNYKAPAEALILSSAAFSSDNGAVSIAISAKESQEQKKDMVEDEEYDNDSFFAVQVFQPLLDFLFSKDQMHSIVPQKTGDIIGQNRSDQRSDQGVQIPQPEAPHITGCKLQPLSRYDADDDLQHLPQKIK